MIGAAAAGFWAMTQEPPSRVRTDEAVRPRVAVEKSRTLVERPKAAIAQEDTVMVTPKVAAAPPSRPSDKDITTSSIPRPANTVARAPGGSMQTISRVRLREKSSTTSPVVTWLEPKQLVRVLAREGKWLRVSVSGRKGWVHGDYLAAASDSDGITRQTVAKEIDQSDREPVAAFTEKARSWFSGPRRPARAPQGGDCQCPYDLMLNGSQCGEHSAYARQQNVQCYL